MYRLCLETRDVKEIRIAETTGFFEKGKKTIISSSIDKDKR